MSSQFILAIDIGYSNLKMAHGHKGEKPTIEVKPAGAGPAELMPERLSSVCDDTIMIDIDGVKWVAGVEPVRLQGWERELHADYPSTKAYQALFYAGLLLSGQKTIDKLVTGLPVSQYMDTSKRQALVDKLQGTHQVSPKRNVEVKEVVVVPQPAGAYMDIIHTTGDQKIMEILSVGRTIVIDPGFFSVDWVALEEGEVRYHSSGTSLKAMSVLLQQTNSLIRDDFGMAPRVDKIEKAYREGKKTILHNGESLALSDYIKRAAETVAHNALTPMKKTMREDGMAADAIILAGGGGQDYKAAAIEVFPHVKNILVPSDPVSSNVRGFWYCG